MAQPPTVIEPRKKPRQARSTVTVDAVLEAAARILQEGGLDALNTNEIARRAGVSVGSLYQYFPTKEAVLAEIIRRKRLRLFNGLTAALEETRGRPLEITIFRLVEVTISHQADKPGFARALEYAYSALPLQQETDDLKDGIVAAISGLLEEHDVPDPRQAARDIVAIVRGMAEAAGLRGEKDRAALATRICRAVLGYLTTDVAAHSRAAPGSSHRQKPPGRNR
ncbi:TetR/AcrR family transcriptional regulator [Hoeflea sp. TYP-13]|uniref:TetR/AcrR family transcriptional regulator n=1 Tax=Hoeflea sp. TYP-13 TaxID=3230023 RepID=UPI0034C65824